jgi:hypothetical protein
VAASCSSSRRSHAPHPAIRNDDGSITEIGPEHPDYTSLLAESKATPAEDRWFYLRAIASGLAAMAGAAALFYSQYLCMRHWQKYYPKVEVLAGFLLTGGLIAVCIGMSGPFVDWVERRHKGPAPKWSAYLLGCLLFGIGIAGIYGSFQIHYRMLSALGYE